MRHVFLVNVLINATGDNLHPDYVSNGYLYVKANTFDEAIEKLQKTEEVDSNFKLNNGEFYSLSIASEIPAGAKFVIE